MIYYKQVILLSSTCSTCINQLSHWFSSMMGKFELYYPVALYTSALSYLLTNLWVSWQDGKLLYVRMLEGTSGWRPNVVQIGKRPSIGKNLWYSLHLIVHSTMIATLTGSHGLPPTETCWQTSCFVSYSMVIVFWNTHKTHYLTCSTIDGNASLSNECHCPENRGIDWTLSYSSAISLTLNTFTET